MSVNCLMDMSNNALEIVTTPTFNWLVGRAKACHSRLLIGCPYVNNAILNLSKDVSNEASRTLITKTDLRDFAMGSSDLNSLCALAKYGVNIRSLSNLHAKIYVFDDDSALVTSANATYGGMYRNLECGIGISDKQLIQRLAHSLLRGLGARKPPCKVGRNELEALRIPLDAIRVSMPKPPQRGDNAINKDEDTSMNDVTFSISSESGLLSGFKGWLRLTLRGVLEMRESEFDIQELYDVCSPMAATEYPNNRYVRQKLSEQLQKLRELGLVEFIKRGHYRRTLN